MLHKARLFYVFVLVLALCSVWPGAPASAEGREPSSYVAGEVLLRLAPGADVRDIAKRHRLKAPTSSAEQLDGRSIFRLNIEDGVAPPQKSAALARDAGVQYAEPNYLGQSPEARQRSSWAVGENDGATAYQAQWAPQKLRLPEAQAISRGAGVTVAILDTGADMAHPALVGHIASGYDFVDDDADASEVGAPGADISFGHGTHVAGLVALAAPDARLMILRTLRPDGVGTLWNQMRALRYAADNGATVINLSWSFPDRSAALDDVLSEVTCVSLASAKCRERAQSGAVVVAAAGNSAANVPEYPAASRQPGVMSVAASTQDDTLAPFSTYGQWVSLAAPGERIVSSVPGGGYASWSGTSMAAPLAAGVVALQRAISPADRPAEVVARLVNTGATISGPVQRRLDAAGAVGRKQ